MNKWSLLLFSVLGILLSTTSELNFVDGRLGCCNHSSRPLLSDTRLSIYEPHCPYRTFTEISQLISPKRDIRYDTRNFELKRSSLADSRRRQFEDKRNSFDERFRDLSNVVFDLKVSTLSNSRDRKVLRETNDLYLRKQLKAFSRDNFAQNHVYRLRSRNNEVFGNNLERNLRDRRFNIEEEIRDNHFRYNNEPISVNLQARNQERFNKRTFVVKTYIIPNQRENIDETTASFIQKKTDMERSNLDINIRQKKNSDTRFTPCLVDLSRNSDRRLKSERIMRNGNIRNYKGLSARDDSTVRMYEKESLTKVRRNIDMDGAINFYRRSYDKDISEENVFGGSSRQRIIQKERSRNIIRDDKKQINNDSEKRFFEEEEEEHYSTRGLPRQHSHVNRLQEIRQARYYNDINIKHGEDYSNVFIERLKRVSDESRNRRMRENHCAIRLNEEHIVNRITPPNKKRLVEKQTFISNINRRNEAIRRSELELRGRESSRFRLEHEDENIFEQKIIRLIRKSLNENKVREPSNSQRTLIPSNAMGHKINNIMQTYDDDKVILVRDNNNRKLVENLELERLSRTGKRASQIRIIQRGNQNKMHNRVIKIQGNKILEDPNFNKRFVFNINRNVEKRRCTYNAKSRREEFRNSLVHEAAGAFDESRITQVRDKHGYRREYRLSVGRTVELVLARTDGNRNKIVERGHLSIIPSIGNNRLYGIRSAVTVLRRRKIYEIRYWSADENEKILDQRRTRDVLEDNLRNELLAKRNLASRNSMNNMLNNNRRSHNDENNSQVILAWTIQRKMTNRSETERFSSVKKRLSYPIMIQREYENRMHNNYRQRTNIQKIRPRKDCYAERCLPGQDSDIKRIVENRSVVTPNEKLNTRNTLASENKRSFHERRNSRLRDSREYRLNDKISAEQVLLRKVNKIIQKRDRRMRPAIDDNQQTQTKHTVILLQFREEYMPSLLPINRFNERNFEKNGNGIPRNKRSTRIEDRSSNIRIAKISDIFKKINGRSNIRGIHDKVTTRYVETKVELHDSVETKNSARTSERDYNREREVQDRARDVRVSNGLQKSNEQSRITKTRTTNEDKREMIAAFYKMPYLQNQHTTQADYQIFQIKLQYIFYMLQGLYILGLFTKFTENSNGIQKRRFSNRILLFRTA